MCPGFLSLSNEHNKRSRPSQEQVWEEKRGPASVIEGEVISETSLMCLQEPNLV